MLMVMFSSDDGMLIIESMVERSSALITIDEDGGSRCEVGRMDIEDKRRR